MPDCNYGIRVKFIGEGGGGAVFRDYGYDTSQTSSQMFSNEWLTP